MLIVKVWNSLEINAMIQDPGSGYGYEAGILFEKSLTVNVSVNVTLTVTAPNGRP